MVEDLAIVVCFFVMHTAAGFLWIESSQILKLSVLVIIYFVACSLGMRGQEFESWFTSDCCPFS